MKSFTLTPTKRSATVYIYKQFCSVKVNAADFASTQLIIEQRGSNGSWVRCATPVLTEDIDWFTFATTDRRQRLRFSVIGSGEFTVPVQVKQSVKPEHAFVTTVTQSGGGGTTTAVQSLGVVAPNDLPNSVSVDTTLGSVAVGHLSGNTVLTLTNATAGDSGILILGNGPGHDGVGFTLDFHVSGNGTHSIPGQHIVMVGDLADFAAAPAAGEYNFGTVAWIYDGIQYYLYVSQVLSYTDPIVLPTS